MQSRLALWLLLLTACLINTRAAASTEERRFRAAYETARLRFEQNRSNTVAAWELGRAAYDLADITKDDQDRNQIAQTGIDACRRAIGQDPDSAPAYYYLALDLGELARGKRLSAIKLLHEMERQLVKAWQLDPAFDYAGPDRSLGILYLEAPVWPAGVGNRNKARSHLQAAVDRSPEYPENLISLAEAYARWGEVKNLERELQAVKESLPKARVRFSGSNWTASWRDWEERVRQLEKNRERLAVNPRTDPAERGARPPR